LHTVKGLRGLAVARELWRERDDLARTLDVSPGRLVPDASLVAAARALPKNKRDLAAMRDFSGRASRSEIDRWWAAIERGLATDDLPQLRIPGDSIPPPRAWGDRNPEADRRLKRARVTVTAIAESLDLPVENLITPDTLRRVAWAPPEELEADAIGEALTALGARPWQVEAIAAPVAADFVAARQASNAAESTAS
jgi:ribonuclease D